MKTILILAGLTIVTSSNSIKESPASIAKQLVFPITGTNASIGSYWGDDRDGGKRKHEGIDIFATKGSPVVAISDGVIEFVGNDDLGGKVITVQPDDYEWEAYYAHLDQQYVSNGQHVKKGQLIGTVGNTGNAKTTSSHLHFGIYTGSGAIDPLPYVKTSPRITSPVPGEKVVAKKTTPVPQRTGTNAKTNTGKEIETTLKNAAISIIRGEVLRRIKL